MTWTKGWYKRPLDLTILVVAHIVLAPVFLALWVVIPLLIWLQDRGPVFYRQERKGRLGRNFSVVKFRTMVPDAERLGPKWTLEHDPRITRIGHVLRRRSLDELPQTISIWKGDMSFVGPRALEVKEHELIETQIDGFRRRLQVRPGLTGLAQVYNWGDAAESKLRYDLEYIRRMNPVLDLKLLFVSVWGGLLGKWDRRRGKSSP